MSRLLYEFFKAPHAIGSIAPSSRALAFAMLKPVRLTQRKVIVELGPGTGAITQAIAPRLRADQRYVGVEINSAMVQLLRLKFPHLDFAAASVEKLNTVMKARGIDTIDAVICSLPWASLPTKVQLRAFAALRKLCPKGSIFVTFAYLQGLPLPGSRALLTRLKAEFSSVKISPIVWRNIPPALVYICEK